MLDPSRSAGFPVRTGASRTGAQEDRRSAERRKVGGLASTIRVNGGDHPLEISDISENGLQGETDVSVHAGQLVEIILPEAGLVRATVRWGVGPYVGVQFEHAIVVPAVSR